MSRTPPPLPPLPAGSSSNGPATPTSGTFAQSNTPDSEFSKLVPPQRPPISVPDLPSDLLSKPAHVLEDLLQNPQAIHGLVKTQSTESEIITSNQIQASRQIQAQRVPLLLNKLTQELPALRETASAALSRAQQAEAEWRALEADMYKALQPFSLRALQLRMDLGVTEAEQVCDSLASSFLDEPGQAGGAAASSASSSAVTGDDSVASFIKQYRKERKTYHMRKEAQERWKEERVGRAY